MLFESYAMNEYYQNQEPEALQAQLLPQSIAASNSQMIKTFGNSEGKIHAKFEEDMTPKTNINEGNNKNSEILKYSTMQNLMSKVRNLVRGYLHDDTQVDNLEESLCLLELGDQLCVNKIEELVQASQMEYESLKEKFEAQFDRINKFSEMINFNVR